MSELKEESKKYDSDKLRMSLLNLNLLDGLVKVLMFGAKKYSPNGWQELDNGTVRYFEALLRHLKAMQKDDGTIDLDSLDEESGLPHLWHAQTNALFLEHFRREKK